MKLIKTFIKKKCEYLKLNFSSYLAQYKKINRNKIQNKS